MHIEQFKPAECRFKFRGKNIAYLSARNTRNLAMNLGVESDGTKLEVYERIVSHLDESGADTVISESAERQGRAAERRLQILHLRFREGLPIREIACLWGVDPMVVHRQYALARKEFRRALMQARL